MKKKINQQDLIKHFQVSLLGYTDEQITELYDGSFLFVSILLPLMTENLTSSVDDFIKLYLKISHILTDAMIEVNGRKFKKEMENGECY